MTATLTPAMEALVTLIREDGYCPTCMAHGIASKMIPAGSRSWVCPVARSEIKRVSAPARASVQATAAARVADLPF